MEETKSVRCHRVGSITFGCGLVVFGVLFLVHMFIPLLISYELIFRLWPGIFILLGVEILVANRKDSVQFVYDRGAIFLIVLLSVFAMGMAGADWLMQQSIAYFY